MSDLPFRVLPRVTAANEHYWRGGEEGRLQFLRCRGDGTWIHPPSPICPVCRGTDLAVEAVSGRGTVHCYTVNHKQWTPVPPPYVIAIVELPEQEGLRVTTNIVGCPPEQVHTGMPVEVEFEHQEDVWIPLFRPTDEEVGA
jgi:uncharacterized protein